MTTINLTDLIPITHGEARIGVDAKRTKGKYQGVVTMEYPRTPKANYVIKAAVPELRDDETEATADAIALRKEMMANTVLPRTAEMALVLKAMK